LSIAMGDGVVFPSRSVCCVSLGGRRPAALTAPATQFFETGAVLAAGRSRADWSQASLWKKK
jgi:hypothetical protein